MFVFVVVAVVIFQM